MELNKIAQNNLQKLKKLKYPGRGIVIGISNDEKSIFQIYWIMGRSVNSKNRIFIMEPSGFVKTHPFDESKLVDPSLVIYYPVKYIKEYHIVSNGDQTDTIFDSIKAGSTFEQAVNKREFEPDPPNYTPRISGIVDLKCREYLYELSINKTLNNNADYPVTYFYNYKKAVPGFGHCITTYTDDGNPLASFQGEPYALPVVDNINENIEVYKDILYEEYAVSILVKEINLGNNNFNIKIWNKNLMSAQKLFE